MTVTSAEESYAVYRGMHALETALMKDKITHTLQSGECAAFDNRRVLHGREKYELKAGGNRKLVGSYIDWDEALSLRRVLVAAEKKMMKN